MTSSTKTKRATETAGAWMHRTHRAGIYDFTTMIKFVNEVESHWEQNGRSGTTMPLKRRCTGYSSGRGWLPSTMTHPVTKERFVFPLMDFQVGDDGLYATTHFDPRCPSCGSTMTRSAANSKRDEAFVCAPCDTICPAWVEVTGSGKAKEAPKVPKADRPEITDHKALITRVVRLVQKARKVAEDHKFTLPIGHRTTAHLAKLAMITGDADEAFRLWIDGRVPASWREKFDAAGLPSGRFRPLEVDPDNPTWYGTIARVLDAGLPVMLVGPAGSGKTFFAKWYAKRVKKDIEVVVGSGDLAGTQLWVSQVSAKNGNTKVHRGPATIACTEGSVLLLDEVDGFDPNSLLPMNAVLNGDEKLSIPILGNLDVSPDVRIIAAANTNGLGHDRTYTARNRLDGAFLNRFAVVVHATYEEKVDTTVAEQAVLEVLESLSL